MENLEVGIREMVEKVAGGSGKYENTVKHTTTKLLESVEGEGERERKRDTALYLSRRALS